MLYYFPLSLSFKPIEKCCTDLYNCFQWKTVFYEKKNQRWIKLNKRKMESALFLLTLNCLNVMV